MTQTTVLNYEAPWPVYALDWCNSAPPGQHTQQRPRTAFRLGLGSLLDETRNRIAVIGLQDERVLVEDDFVPGGGEGGAGGEGGGDFVTLVEAQHGYPATSLQWQPASANGYAWSGKAAGAELLATTGDALRVWEYAGDGTAAGSAYVGRPPPPGGAHRLTLKTALSGQSKVQNNSTGAPLTNFSWNAKSPSLVVTASIDTTCTVWNIDTSTAITQLIAHDREVYDVAWLPNSTDIFVSVGADGSLRAFDLRSLEHSTILYETPAPKNLPPPTSSPSSSARPPTSPLLRIAFNPADSNYMSTFHMDGPDVQILDMRSPGQPVMELRGHRAPVNALGWSSTNSQLLASAGDDCQLLLWDMAPHTSAASATTARTGSGGLSSPRPDAKKRVITDPVMAYGGGSEIVNLAWSPYIGGLAGGHNIAPGEWIAVAMGKTIKALKV